MSYKDGDRVYAWLDAGNGEKLTTLDRAVLVMIAERANATSGRSAPGVAEIARRWGVDDRSVRRSIARLHRLGLVDTVTRGQGQRRARYSLIGELAGPTGPPTGGEVAGPKRQVAGPTGPSSRTDGSSVLSKSSRSSNEVMTDDPSARASPALVSDEVIDHVAATLDLTDDEARTWTADRLTRANGHVNNPDAYIRQALKCRASGFLAGLLCQS
jgi:Helix-turn-helix domain